ncbi:MAG: PAS domain-containing sensor histidine kinase [Sulfurospirillaceae bacterium]|nr:PAS domain-containing sensor histidine kinase [Sulfurospirillaceae bacterium]MDD3462701.1 PAS domain-containing sensor histidine kinase [Sulfurospirillaceae bacterium]
MKLKQYKEAIENSNIVSKTDINGIITFVNDEFCKISGYTREELVGKNHNIVRHPDVPPIDFKILWETIKDKKTYKTTAKNIAKDGTVFYVNTTIVPILDENKEIKEFIAIRYDVTKSVELQEALKRKEEELEALNATLEERVKFQTKALVELNATLEETIAQEVEKNRKKDQFIYQQARLASMGEMIANIAHQWRQPLSELSMVLYKMKKIHIMASCDKDDFYNKSYEHAKKIISNMSDTIEGFRNFFSPHRQGELFSLGGAIKDVWFMVEGVVAKEDIIQTTKILHDVKILGSVNDFSHVLINIINNSIEAYRSKDYEKKEISIVLDKNKKGSAIITVCDKAGGIDKTILDKIFEPYFTTKHASAGTGLGLYMSKMIVEKNMMGSIRAYNKDSGACFEIEVPIFMDEYKCKKRIN